MNSWHAISLVIALESLAATAGVCGAQTAARLGLDAGATAPVSAYGSDKNVGYHIGLLVDVRVLESPLGFRIDGAFHELKYSGNATKEQIWMANANLVLKAPTGTMVVPYAIGGAGIYSSHRTLFLGTRARTNPGLNLGGGLRFELGDVTTFVEARYHIASGTAGIRLLPATLGILF